MYALMKAPDLVKCLESGATIPRGHLLWDSYELWLAAGNSPEPLSLPSRQDLVDQTRALITQLLDSTVKARGYDNIVSCVSYVGDVNPTFDAEARAARAWRSAVYTAGYAILADTPEGVTTPEEVIALMPAPQEFGWPE